MLIDSHCHLNLLEFNNDYPGLDAIMAACKDYNIKHLLSVATELKSFSQLVKIAEKYPNVSISAGVHPNEDEVVAGEFDISLSCLYDNLFKQASNNHVVAIGETGLDYYRTEDSSQNKQWQQERFAIHIDVAKKLNKPLIIHTRQASEDTIDVMKHHNAAIIGGVMHCFTENWQVAKQALDLGFYISISGIVTFKNATQVQEVAQKVPLDRLLVETDCPFLAPIPHRGKPNYPQYVKYVAEKIAELRGVGFDVVAENTTNNFYRLFKRSVTVTN